MAESGKDQLSTPLRIGAIYTIGPYLFPHLIPELNHSASGMRLYIKESYTHVLRKKLRIGELDAIIVSLPFTEPDVLTLPLYDEPFRVLLPSGHHWEQKETVDPLELATEDMLLLGAGHCFRDQILEVCPLLAQKSEAGEDKVKIESTSLETVRHMVASGMGITVLPQSAMGELHYAADILSSKPFKAPAPSRTVALAWRASFSRPKAIEMLSSALKLCRIPVSTGQQAAG